MSKKKKKKMKTNPKIYVLSFFIVVFITVLAFASYITFFADADLHNLGYSYSEIRLLRKYELEEEVTTYNKSLTYALNSTEFNENNLDYYLLFNSEMDLTRVCNNLAAYYTVDEVEDFLTYLTQDEVEQLADCAEISDISLFRQLYEKGYDLTASVELTNSLPDSSVEIFLSLDVLSDYTSYLNYLETGYGDDVIAAIYYQLGEENFNNFSTMRLFNEGTIYTLVNVENFAAENLPRYLMYLENNSSAKEADAVEAVNSNKDYVSPSKIDYGSYYDDSVETSDEGILTLVNKSHQLTISDVPTLISVDVNYRFTECQLVEEAANAFMEMADQLYAENERTILAYTTYVSYTQQDLLYADALVDAYNDSSLIDSYTLQAGSSEHQTGLAVDITEKDSTYTKFTGSKSSIWLQENAYKYGFILRYKEGKEFLTGVDANDYHYRYVGVEAATIIYTYDWVYEEYYYLYIGD